MACEVRCQKLALQPEDDAEGRGDYGSPQADACHALRLFGAQVLRDRRRRGVCESDGGKEKEADASLRDAESSRFHHAHRIDDRLDDEERDACENVLQRERRSDPKNALEGIEIGQEVLAMEFDREAFYADIDDCRDET